MVWPMYPILLDATYRDRSCKLYTFLFLILFDCLRCNADQINLNNAQGLSRSGIVS